MTIQRLIERLKTIQETWNNLKLPVYMEILENTECPTCGEPEIKKVDGYLDTLSVNEVDNKLCVWLICSNRMKGINNE